MQVFKCDICGKDTWYSPPTKQKTKEVVEKNYKGEDVTSIVPSTTIMKRQNICTGDIEDIEVAEFEDLKPRTILIQLHAGMESIKKDFCKECYSKSSVKLAVNNLWLEMEKIRSK